MSRLEARIALELLTRRLSDPRLATGGQRFEFVANTQFWGPTKLWAE